MFLDIGLGIISSIIVSKLFHVGLSWGLIGLGIGFALMPDLDFIFYLMKHGNSKSIHRHRDLLHLPLLYIPIGFVILYFVNIPVAMLFVLCSLCHFLHDSFGIGWGVQWLYPLSTNHFMLLYRYHAPEKPAVPFRVLYSWKRSEIDELSKKYGDDNWFRNIYLKMHPFAIMEWVGFLLAIVILYVVKK